MSNSANVTTRQALPFHHASDLPQDVWDALRAQEARANLILPLAEKAKDLPRENNEHLWIVVYNAGRVELILSCTKGLVDNYPIFILPCKSADRIAHEEKQGKSIADALLPLVCCLLKEVSPKRVFSVFSIAKVTEKFAELFVAQAPEDLGIKVIQDPYYNATFTFCTSETLREPSDAVSPFPGSEDIQIAIRPGVLSDLKQIAALCKAFSETSPPFILDDAGAELEARSMIENHQVWVHVIIKDGQEEIACLVATTRGSENVTTVTKVFTSPHWRGHGCAARLLHRVCQEVLKKKKKVVLYVGNSKELEPARKVYHKIGFQGLIPQGLQVKDVERWLEIGFENTDLGYW